MAFYDYDMVNGINGECYVLCRNGQRVTSGGTTITIKRVDNEVRYCARQWDGNRKHETLYRSLDDAMTAGVRWAERRVKKVARS